MAYTPSSYLADGPQAVFLLKVAGEETYYTDGERALRAWEKAINEVGHADLYQQKTGTTAVTQLR